MTRCAASVFSSTPGSCRSSSPRSRHCSSRSTSTTTTRTCTSTRSRCCGRRSISSGERNPDAAPDVPLRLAALLHDIGKPATRKLEPGGGVTFYHHDLKGARLARKRLQELRFDSDTTTVVTRLIELHLRFFGYAEGAWTDSAVRRYVRDAEAELERLHILTRADVTTRNAKKAGRLARAYDDIERRIAELSAAEELGAMRPELDGNRIQEVLGIRARPRGRRGVPVPPRLRLDEGIVGEDEAERRLREWWAARP